MSSPKLGQNMFLAYNSATVATPTWVDIDEIDGAAVSEMAREFVAMRRRANSQQKGLIGDFTPPTITFKYLQGMNETVFDALRTAFLAGTVMEFVAMDGDPDTSGSEGWRMPMVITGMPRDEPYGDVAAYNFECRVAYMEESSSEIDFSWYTVS